MSPSSSRSPVLVNLANNERFAINVMSFSIGRAADNDFVLPEDEYASAHHSRIFWQQGNWWIEDLKSSNGTFVNDKMIDHETQLSPGNTIKVGHTVLRIE